MIGIKFIKKYDLSVKFYMEPEDTVYPMLIEITGILINGKEIALALEEIIIKELGDYFIEEIKRRMG